MQYKAMTLQELKHSYLTAGNDLEKELLLIYGKYRKLNEMNRDQLLQEWKKATGDDKALIERIGKAKKANNTFGIVKV